MLFTAGSDIKQKVQQRREERVSLVQRGFGPVATLQAEGGFFFLHIVPFASVSGNAQINLQSAYDAREKLLPLGNAGYAPRFNFDGFLNAQGNDGKLGYLQMFRDGIIEVVKTGLVRKIEQHPNGVMAAITFEEQVLSTLPRYMSALQSLQVPPPFAVTMTLIGAKGAQYWVSTDSYGFDEPQPIENNSLFLPPCIIDAYGSDAEYHQALKPAFDALWNAAGRPSAQWFTGPGGLWQRPPRN